MVNSESEILVSRFRPEQRSRIALDLKREDDLLREYIDTGKLDFWFKNILSSVESQVVSGNSLIAPDLDAGTMLRPTSE